MKNNSFSIKDFPSKKLETIGVSKKEQNAAFGYEDMQKMLNGQKTEVINLQYQKDGMTLDVDGRFSLRRNADNTVSLMVHKVEREIRDDLNLSEKTKAQLQAGEIVQSKQKEEVHLMQLDKQTNQVLSIQQSKLIVPDFINDVQLSLDQKNALRQGQPIELIKAATAEKGETSLTVKLDLNQRSGFKVKVVEQKLNLNKEQKIEQKPTFKRGM
jgi:Protein of unknown function (DUF4099)/Protein of unknown function (DUF3945)